MRRFSRTWWITILLVSDVIGVGAIFLLYALTNLGFVSILAVGVALIFLGDLLLAVYMEAVAPTRVSVGPGEKLRNSDVPAEKATVVADFDDAGRGRVSIRGETWRAMQSSEAQESLTQGARVRVVRRDGLILIVTPCAR